jgi:hypothetical protein
MRCSEALDVNRLGDGTSKALYIRNTTKRAPRRGEALVVDTRALPLPLRLRAPSR